MRVLALCRLVPVVLLLSLPGRWTLAALTLAYDDTLRQGLGS